MKLGILTKPQNFNEWLDAATHDLVPSAQALVRSEIETHYAEAVKSHLAQGSTESVAQSLALADLGNAHVAAKRFRREYVTVSNTLTIAGILESNRGLLWSKSSRVWRWVFSGFILFGFLGSSLGDTPLQDALLFALAWLFVMGWACVVHNVAKLVVSRWVGQSRTPASLRQLLLIQALGRAAFWLPFLGAVSDLSWRHFFYLVIVIGVNGCDIERWLHIRQKLRSAVADDLASCQPRTA